MGCPHRRLSFIKSIFALIMTFNLCTDSWLPVRMLNGEQLRLSLCDIFTRSQEIADLVLLPHERIAVMRLLICVTQRALNGPKDAEEREECMDNIIPAVAAYLSKWRGAFELLGEHGAFLQFAHVEPVKQGVYSSLATLNMARSSGHNATVFDHGELSGYSPDPALVALDLLSFQNFSVCGKIGIALWNQCQTAPKAPDSVTAAPCICSSAVHLFLKADSLLETIALNVIPFDSLCPGLDGIGVPVWEKMPSSADDADAVDNAAHTYLGRLVPVSRCVSILPDLGGCVIARGVDYSTYEDGQLTVYEGSMTIALSEKDQSRHLVKGDVSRSLWRNLPALLHRFSKHYQLPHVFDNENLPPIFSVWIGALVADKAKLIDVMEDEYTHLSPHTADDVVLGNMRSLLRSAESGAGAVKGAVKSYLSALVDARDFLKGLPDSADKEYWQRLAASRRQLLSLAEKMAQAETEAELNKSILEWALLIQDAAAQAYNAVVPHQTVRQLHAWAKGRRFLPHPHQQKKQ